MDESVSDVIKAMRKQADDAEDVLQRGGGNPTIARLFVGHSQWGDDPQVLRKWAHRLEKAMRYPQEDD